MKVSKQMLHQDLQPHYYKTLAFQWLVRIKALSHLMNFITDTISKGKDIEGLHCDEVMIPSHDGSYAIRTRIYRPQNTTEKLPALLYIHGGGYILGNPEQSASMIEALIKRRPCVIIAPSYRKAYTEPYPAGFNDCYDALLWIKANAGQLDLSSDRIMVAGHSAGGGLTAAVTLKARDTGDVDIPFQMPIYPMIDDTQPEDPARDIDSPIWNSATNRVGWNAYLAGLRQQGKEIPAYAAAARNTDYQGFPPTATLVGTLDPFYQETVDYVNALKAENIDVAFEQYEGCFHGFEIIIPGTAISKAARDFTYQAFADYYDRYVQ